MNGEQARALQQSMGTRPREWPLWKSRFLDCMSRNEILLFRELWEEFWDDEGNLFRIPFIIRDSN